MPWLFKATWAIIKAFLNEEQKAMISFVSKSELESWIGKSEWIDEMGGPLKYTASKGKLSLPADFPDKKLETSLAL